jgi:hypothetical protein
VSERASPPDDDIVAFFLALSPEARRDYERLAEADRRFGEDVVAERRALGAGKES